MHYPETIEKASELLRLVVPYLAKYRLPANPVNYTVAYERYRGGDRELVSLIEERERDEELPDGTFFNELFERFFVHMNRDQCIALGEALHVTVEALLGKLAENSSGVGDISGELADTLTGLESLNDTGDVREMVGRLVHITERLNERTLALHQDLEETRKRTAELQEELQQAREQATTDALTGLGNRYGFDKALEELVSGHRNQNKRMVAMLLDIDHFKKVNDTYGHIVGDQVLRKVGKTIRDVVASVKHVAARYGGEEFVVLLPETPPQAALKLAEEIRKRVSSLRLAKRGTGEKLPPITISGGIALYQRGEEGHQWLSRADDALYQAKFQGRDLIICDNC